MLHEHQKQNIPVLHFQAEGYVSTKDIEFLDQFNQFLENHGINPDELVFSGFDGTNISGPQDMQHHLTIYVMNQAGWKDAVKYHKENPADIADGFEVPVIGLYKKSDLSEVISGEIKDTTNTDDRIELDDVKLSNPLNELSSDVPISEAVVHKNYPDSSPTDALVGLIFIDR